MQHGSADPVLMATRSKRRRLLGPVTQDRVPTAINTDDHRLDGVRELWAAQRHLEDSPQSCSLEVH